MKRHILVIGAALAAIAVMSYGISARVEIESPPDGSACQTVTLTLKSGARSGPWTWTAMRAFDDSGMAETIPKGSHSTDSLVSVAIQIDSQCVSRNGADSFILRRIFRSSETNEAGQLRREGTWSIVDGTGVYSALRGKGTLVEYDSDTLVVNTLTGVVWTAK